MIKKLYILLIVFILLSSCTKKENKKTLLVSSAISLSNPLEKIASIYKNKNKATDIVFNFASSGELENQIVQGANVDIFISASTREISRLDKKNVLLDNSIKTIASGELVVVSLKKEKYDDANFITNNNYDYLAIGETNIVPAGMYAIEALENMGVIKDIYKKLVYGKNVREVITWAITANADYAIVYKSDTLKNDKINIVFNIDKNTHKQIVYQASIIKTSKNIKEATDFITFLESSESKNILLEYGFTFEY